MFMEQTTQPKDNIFRHKVNTVQASDLETCAETHNFSLKKIKSNKMWAAHHSNLSKHFFRQGRNILPFEWTICVRYNWRCHFLDKVKVNKHLASDLPMHAETQNLSLKKK